MARRRKQLKRRERRRQSNKVWVRLGIVLVVLVPLAYFAFTQYFFDPFEGSQPRFDVLVPRDVDLFVHRERLDSDVVSFPRLALLDRLSRTREWRDMAASDWWAGLELPGQLAAMSAQASEAAGLAPMDLDPMADLLGSEVALVGRLPDKGLGESQYVLMARLSNKAKVLIEGLDYALEEAFPGARMTTVPDPEWPGLTYRRLEIPEQGVWYFARELDLLVVGRGEVLVRDVLRMVLGNEETSLGLSRLYQGELPRASREPDERFSLPFMVDLSQVFARTEGDEDLTEESTDALATALAKLVDLTLFEEMVGRVEMDNTLSVRLYSELDQVRAESARAGLLGVRPFRVDERMGAVLALVPADTSFVVTFNCDLDALLTTLSDSFSPDVVKLINDTIRGVGRFTAGWPVETLHGPRGLIRHLDRALGDEITIAMRPADHEFAPGSQPLPALAFFFRVRDLSLWNELDNAMVRGRQELGLGQDDLWQQDEGVGMRKWIKLPAGLPMEEIAYIVLDRETAVIATDLDFLREIVMVYASSRSSLGTRAEAREGAAALGQPLANLAFWGSAPRLLELIEPFGEYLAEESTAYDRVAARLTQRNHLINSNYRTYKGREGEMPPEVVEELEARLTNLMVEMERKRHDETIPAAATAWRESRQWLRLFGSVSGALRLGEHDADLVLSAETTLGG
jgi:hypothetical protein